MAIIRQILQESCVKKDIPGNVLQTALEVDATNIRTTTEEIPQESWAKEEDRRSKSTESSLRK